MASEFSKLAELDRVIHSPARLMVVSILTAVNKADFLYLLRETELTKGNLSTHLSKLEEAGYIIVEKTYKGKVPLTLYSLTKAGKQAFKGYRKQLKYIIDNTA
ncbi:MAG: ArsR family transcriptional regulator [Chloroflexi bacterium]|nr:MAG: ArsR family transcriptional regulator [Chloroflexota bacterium]MBL1195842.1 ArsR family transcriptional regulator [Chloroflexota bacterium]NOH13134.1 transcriptional regulator [Chloroflexota bacterium]